MKQALVVFFLLLPAILPAGPVIKFKSLEVDFGQANAGKTLDIVFEFENAGDEVLVIKRIVPGCGCTTTDLKKKEYRPGEKGTIVAKFNTSGYSGRVVKTINVVSNDGARADLQLLLRGVVILKDFARALLEPNDVPFGTIRVGKAQVRKFKLSNTGTLDLRVLEVSHGPEVTLEFRTDIVPPGQSREIVLRFVPFARGNRSAMIKIRTNDIQQPYAFIRLEAQAE